MGNIMKADLQIELPVMEDSLPAVLLRVVNELNDVAQRIEKIEPMLVDLHPETEHHTVERMMVLQGIDLAVQKARGLAEFLGQMTSEMPAAWTIDATTALNLVKLADMRRALSQGKLDHCHAPPILKASGDFEAF
jgi:hypothetical protein